MDMEAVFFGFRVCGFVDVRMVWGEAARWLE